MLLTNSWKEWEKNSSMPGILFLFSKTFNNNNDTEDETLKEKTSQSSHSFSKTLIDS